MIEIDQQIEIDSFNLSSIKVIEHFVEIVTLHLPTKVEVERELN